ncbi:MAG TPA: hypothetical protein VFK15_14805 [Burkholderiales bacterium]|nr:hypothetical protein [Burkholderiales bacterium]
MPPAKVLVLGDYRQTITIVRSLGRAGCEVILVCDRPRSATAHSTYVSGMEVLDASSPERYRETLQALIERERPQFAFPVGEAEPRRLLHDGRHALAAACRWVMPDPATVLHCFDKRAMYRLAAAIDVPVAPWRPYTGVLACLRDAEGLGYPVVLKRNDSSARLLGTNSLICRSALELEAFLAELQHEPDCAALILQKYAPGRRHNCHFAAQRGSLVAFFQQQVLSTDGREGTGIGIEGISVAPSAALRRHCARLLSHLGYHGIGCIQFLVDEPSGSVAFLEINARMDSTAALPYRLGIDFPLIALKLAANERIEPPAPYAVGKRYYYLYGALNVWLAQRRRVPLARVLAWPFLAPWTMLRSFDLVLDWRDPLPALHQFAHRIAEYVAKSDARSPHEAPAEAPVESSARL